jgi:hypothetical protein
MSIDQMEGKEEMHENWGDMVLGEDVDIHGDPPRLTFMGERKGLQDPLDTRQWNLLVSLQMLKFLRVTTIC